MGLRPVHRIKHVRDQQGGLTLGVVGSLPLIKTVDAPTLSQTDEVETGSTVNGIFINLEVYATTAGALANAYMYIWKNPGGNLIRPSANAVGSNDNKKYVFHQEMVMLEKKVNGLPRTVFKGVVVIPKGYRRNGPNDITEIVLLSPGVDVDFCMQAHYKEFK